MYTYIYRCVCVYTHTHTHTHTHSRNFVYLFSMLHPASPSPPPPPASSIPASLAPCAPSAYRCPHKETALMGRSDARDPVSPLHLLH